MFHFQKRLLIAAMLLPAAVAAQNSDFVQKADHSDIERIFNISLGSENPAFIGRNTFSSLADIKIGYAHSSGSFHDVDDGKVINGMNFDFYGVKKLGKLAFEGSFAYDYSSLNNRNWNSTLFVSSDNPFKISDRVESDFTNEVFRLNGGVSYDISDRWALGLRADYLAGSSANETDPRPEIDGMRFRISPGATYKTGSFTFGLAGHAELLSESTDYTVVRTTVSHIAYLMQGLSQPVQRQALSYSRKYNGHELGGSAQMEWKNDALGNFLEIGYAKNQETAKDNELQGKYRGGKYSRNSYFLKDRVMFGSNRLRHQIYASARYNEVNGTTYEQKQTSDMNGNTYWEVLSSAVTYKNKYADACIGYRADYLTFDKAPKATGEISAGMHTEKADEYPDGYFQKFTTGYVDVDAKYRFNVRRAYLIANLGAKFNARVSDSQELQGTSYDNIYLTPKYEYAAAEYYRVRARVDAHLPLKIKGLRTWIGIYAAYSYTGYNGSSATLENSSRNNVDTGVRLIF